MAIRAVVFDIGDVLEIAPDLGVSRRWEARLGFAEGEFGRRLAEVWAAGAIGVVTEDEVRQAVSDRLDLAEEQADAFMADVWEQYLGTGNTELIEYCRGLRPRYRTGILSNSFVGAREREQTAYGFEDLVDDIVYSHEIGMSKPDPRIYELSCARLEVRPEEVIFLDDIQPNIAAARAVGIHGIHYRDNAQAIAEIEELLTPAGNWTGLGTFCSWIRGNTFSLLAPVVCTGASSSNVFSGCDGRRRRRSLRPDALRHAQNHAC